eukprot:jgi/Chrzof1/5431/Cz16g02220.t1
MEHDVSGTITILDDCSFRVTGFTYDGQAPAAYWWGGPAVDMLYKAGFELNSNRLETSSNGVTLVINLAKGVTWDKVKVISVWCKAFAADFGHLELDKLQAARPKPSKAVSPTPKASAPKPKASAPKNSSSDSSRIASPGTLLKKYGLTNCVTLQPGKLNLYWKLDTSNPATAKTITIALEGSKPSSRDSWMSFGFPPGNSVKMIGSDVVTVGTNKGKCFAQDFYLSDYAQCDQGTQKDGVCPDSGFAGKASANNVKLLGCMTTATAMLVVAQRPLKASDKWDRNWSVTKAGAGVWAYGPVSDASPNAETPVVLYHGVSQHAKDDFKINLGAKLPANSKCNPIIKEGTSTKTPAGSKTPAAAPAPKVATLSCTTSFDVITAENPNYPNPPAWGISYHLNGKETPVIRVIRENTYTFRVMAGPTHPFYITNSIVGANSLFDNQTVYAGSADSHGTKAKPHILKWTVKKNTPNLVYYQCWTHMKLGWKVEVVDKDASCTTKAAPSKLTKMPSSG